MKKRTAYERHCSEEVLLAYLDSELSRRERAAVGAHLDVCWQCRVRKEDLEEEIGVLTKRLGDLGLPPPARVAEAEFRLLQYQKAFERNLAMERSSAIWREKLPVRVVARAICLVLCLSGVAGWYYAREFRSLPSRGREIRRPIPREAPPAVEDFEAAPQRPRALPTAVPPAGVPADMELRVKEAAALYAIHQVRACLGEPIEVKRTPDGRLLVLGIVQEEQRKRQLLAALSEIGGAPWLRVEIRTVHEAAEGEPAGEAPTAGPPLVISQGEDLYFREALERYFADKEGAEGPTSRLNEFVSLAVSFSDALLSEGWALRKLAEHFPSDVLAALPPESRRLVEVMVRDHLRALETRAREAGAELGPALSAIARDRQERDVEWTSPGYGSWQERVFEIFRTVEQVRSHVVGLFAGAGLPLHDSGGMLRTKPPELTVQDLRSALAVLGPLVRSTEAGIAGDFSAPPAVAAQTILREH